VKNLSSGENSIVEIESFRVTITCSLATNPPSTLAASAFLLSQDGKVRDDNDFIFYNQPKSLDDALILFSQNDGKQCFDIDLKRINSDVQKIAFVITSSVALMTASALSIEIESMMAFSPDTTVMHEKSLILAELYRNKGAWKFRAIGQGFKGGLAPVAEGYGVDISDEQEVVVTKAETSVQLSKTSIDLTKAGEKVTISLAKGAKLTAKLRWETKADLDLYCFYVDTSQNEDKVYYRKLGDLTKPPFIKLLGDSQDSGEEILEISQPQNIKYALICAYSAMSNGTGSFYSYKARVVVTDNDKQEVTSHLAYKDPYSYWVAFALIDFTKTDEITINNVETYANKKLFAQQFEQRTGEKPSTFFHKAKSNVNGVDSYDPEKSPYLFKNGDFMMSVGEAEFK
jgi:stress response protein SCP2